MAKESAKASKSDLTDRQLRFCHEYLTDFNATRAATAAGYSPNTAGQIGHENLKKPEIRKVIESLQKQALEDLFVSRTAVVRELARYDFRGRSSSYTQVQDKVALMALRLLGQSFGVFSENQEDEWLKEAKEAFRRADEALRREKELEIVKAKEGKARAEPVKFDPYRLTKKL